MGLWLSCLLIAHQKCHTRAARCMAIMPPGQRHEDEGHGLEEAAAASGMLAGKGLESLPSGASLWPRTWTRTKRTTWRMKRCCGSSCSPCCRRFRRSTRSRKRVWWPCPARTSHEPPSGGRVRGRTYEMASLPSIRPSMTKVIKKSEVGEEPHFDPIDSSYTHHNSKHKHARRQIASLHGSTCPTCPSSTRSEPTVPRYVRAWASTSIRPTSVCSCV